MLSQVVNVGNKSVGRATSVVRFINGSVMHNAVESDSVFYGGNGSSC